VAGCVCSRCNVADISGYTLWHHRTLMALFHQRLVIVSGWQLAGNCSSNCHVASVLHPFY
jgi:hypothetical protein